MTMNKKEKQYVEDLEKSEEFNKQLIKTLSNLVGIEVTPDVKIPNSSLSKGWLYNESSLRVLPSCSSRTGHSFGNNERTTTQNPKELYSTELLATKAMRYEKVQKFLKELVELDQRIENLEGEQQ